jgi:hypothetical protein
MALLFCPSVLVIGDRKLRVSAKLDIVSVFMAQTPSRESTWILEENLNTVGEGVEEDSGPNDAGERPVDYQPVERVT